MTSKRVRNSAFASAVAVACAAEVSSASLTFDLVAVAVKKNNSTTVTVANPKVVSEAAVGDILRLRLYAIVTGTDPSKAQTFQSASGSLMSTGAGTAKGDWKQTRVSLNTANTGAASHLSAPWSGQASSTGLAQDLDGDGDIDLGSNNDAASDNFVAYRSNQLEGPRSNNSQGISDFAIAPTTTAASTKYVLSNEIDWVVTNPGSPPQLNWRLRSGQSAVWFEDATETSNDVNGDGSVIQYAYSGGTTGTVQLVGTPVSFTPEATTGLVGLTGLGARVLRRRSPVRRQR